MLKCTVTVTTAAGSTLSKLVLMTNVQCDLAIRSFLDLVLLSSIDNVSEMDRKILLNVSAGNDIFLAMCCIWQTIAW